MLLEFSDFFKLMKLKINYQRQLVSHSIHGSEVNVQPETKQQDVGCFLWPDAVSKSSHQKVHLPPAQTGSFIQRPFVATPKSQFSALNESSQKDIVITSTTPASGKDMQSYVTFGKRHPSTISQDMHKNPMYRPESF